MGEKALVLYSGGLDSRLTVKLLQEKGYKITALHFTLPFGCGCCNLGCNLNFTQKEKIKLVILDVTKGKLLKEYIEILKNPNHGRGTAYNPCRDCKIWMFRKAKEYADKKGIKVIATGEVKGQRPMSQTRFAMDLIDRKLGFKIMRPLTDLGIVGRRRNIQMELAKKYGISYPTPGGGCLLCEKALEKRFKVLLDKNLITEKTLPLVSIGRHFFIEGIWFVVGRDEKENDLIEVFSKKNVVLSDKGKPAVYFNDSNYKEKAKELQASYSKGKKRIFEGERL